MAEEEKDKKEEAETGKPEKETERENKEEKPKKEESSEAVSIKIKKDDIWKYSTILLLALLLVGGVIFFTGGVMKDDDKNAPSPTPTPTPQPPSTVQVSIDDDPILGNRNAPVTIVEFSDYECPFCGRFYSATLPSIKSNYIDTGKVRFVYRDFPLNFHPSAQPAAEASECVREKGGDEAFWKYHDTIFENQPMLSTEKLLEWASEMGHDIEECLNSNKFAAEVQKDMRDGQNVGIQGTPGFIIGKTDGNSVRGQIVSGAQPFAVFQQIIDAELRGS